MVERFELEIPILRYQKLDLPLVGLRLAPKYFINASMPDSVGGGLWRLLVATNLLELIENLSIDCIDELVVWTLESAPRDFLLTETLNNHMERLRDRRKRKDMKMKSWSSSQFWNIPKHWELFFRAGVSFRGFFSLIPQVYLEGPCLLVEIGLRAEVFIPRAASMRDTGIGSAMRHVERFQLLARPVKAGGPIECRKFKATGTSGPILQPSPAHLLSLKFGYCSAIYWPWIWHESFGSSVDVCVFLQ